MTKQPMFFAGSSHMALARAICSQLKINLGRMRLNQFPDGETDVQILETVRGRDVFVLQSLAGEPNHYLCELLIIIDALKRSSANSITAVIPYLGYCRQDRKNEPGVPITAKLVANLLATAGITHLITFDLHSDQIEGFFETTVDHLHCQYLLSNVLKELIEGDYVVVAPDIGGVKIAESMAKLLNTELVVIKKERLNPFDVTMTLIGNVQDKKILITDDLCSTAGTLVAAANLCHQHGAQTIIGAVTHGHFVSDAMKKIKASALEYLVITDTIAQQSPLPAFVKTTSVAPMIAEIVTLRQS